MMLWQHLPERVRVRNAGEATACERELAAMRRATSSQATVLNTNENTTVTRSGARHLQAATECTFMLLPTGGRNVGEQIAGVLRALSVLQRLRGGCIVLPALRVGNKRSVHFDSVFDMVVRFARVVHLKDCAAVGMTHVFGTTDWHDGMYAHANVSARAFGASGVLSDVRTAVSAGANCIAVEFPRGVMISAAAARAVTPAKRLWPALRHVFGTPARLVYIRVACSRKICARMVGKSICTWIHGVAPSIPVVYIWAGGLGLMRVRTALERCMHVPDDVLFGVGGRVFLANVLEWLAAGQAAVLVHDGGAWADSVVAVRLAAGRPSWDARLLGDEWSARPSPDALPEGSVGSSPVAGEVGSAPG